MDKFIDRICNRLTENNISVFKALRKKNDNRYYIMADKVLIVVDQEKVITVCFSVAATPDYAGKVILALRTIKCEKIDVGETFIYNERGEYFGGEEAHKLMDKMIKEKIIGDFVTEQMKKHILFNDECFNC
jgi:hypothetical protein